MNHLYATLCVNYVNLDITCINVIDMSDITTMLTEL